ncbi:hypothetical protein GALL_313390 [mine drainage metagenome]|uniref:Uncharacterized protein n=1 Tax=mine drainage metagenome TaxID=410659 RepID=A0A1J5RF85_9ZZZZ
MVVLGALILCLCAVVFLWYGFEIRYRDRFELIDRFTSRRLRDRASWARLCGLLQMLLGAALLATALTSLLWPPLSRGLALAFIVGVLAAWGPLVTNLRNLEDD